MGRNAHVLRIALGRNADQAPDWPSLRHRYVALDCGSDQGQGVYSAVDSNGETTLRQCFNEKGQPVDRTARDLDRFRCQAQNAVVGIALPAVDHSGTAKQAQSAGASTKQADWISAHRLVHAVDLLSVAWLASFRNRLSMLRSLNQAPTLGQALRLELDTLGAFEMFTAGYSCSLLEHLSLGSSLRESLSRFKPFKPSTPQDGQCPKIVSAITSAVFLLSSNLFQGAIMTAAHVQALHIYPCPTPGNSFPWTQILRSSNFQELFTGVTHVFLPAWILCMLQFHVRTVAEGLLVQGSSPHHNNRIYHSLDDQGQHSPRDPRMRSLKWLAAQIGSAIRETNWKLANFLGWNAPSIETKIVKNYNPVIQTVARLPARFASDVFPRLCRQILSLPISGIFSRSLVWLLIQDRSPFRIGVSIARQDLYPVLPTIQDFTPGIGLTTTLNFVQKLGLSFVLQLCVSLALVGAKSTVALAMLKDEVEELVPSKGSNHPHDARTTV